MTSGANDASGSLTGCGGCFELLPRYLVAASRRLTSGGRDEEGRGPSEQLRATRGPVRGVPRDGGTVRLVDDDEFDRLTRTFDREALHLETRDAYGTEAELPYMARWAAGQPDDLSWLGDWCANLRAHRAAGRSMRRARVVSEPLSDYQRWSHGIAGPMVEAGEDIRWVPRRLVSSIAFPGNDFYLFDDRLAVFLTYSGNGLAGDRIATTDPRTVQLCRSAFDAVWALAVPHGDYRPR